VNAAAEAALLAGTAARAGDDAARRERLTSDLRERRVRVIRSIHSSGGAVDARFQFLRAQQTVSVVARQVEDAEKERLQLKLELASVSAELQGSMNYIAGHAGQ
jgi:hypothetical protein